MYKIFFILGVALVAVAAFKPLTKEELSIAEEYEKRVVDYLDETIKVEAKTKAEWNVEQASSRGPLSVMCARKIGKHYLTKVLNEIEQIKFATKLMKTIYVIKRGILGDRVKWTAKDPDFAEMKATFDKLSNKYEQKSNKC